MNKREPHSNGLFTVRDDSIYPQDLSYIAEEPALILDTETGTVLKTGDLSFVKPYYTKAYAAMEKTGFPCSAEALRLITFKKYGALSPDQVCTLMNYLCNHLEPEQIQELLSMDEQSMITKLDELYKVGW